MIRTILKLFAYSRAPKTTFSLLHPRTAVRLVRAPLDAKTSRAPRLAALATAAVVAPLAYRLGRRAGEGTLLSPGAGRRAATPAGASAELSVAPRPLD